MGLRATTTSVIFYPHSSSPDNVLNAVSPFHSYHADKLRAFSSAIGSSDYEKEFNII